MQGTEGAHSQECLTSDGVETPLTASNLPRIDEDMYNFAPVQNSLAEIVQEVIPPTADETGVTGKTEFVTGSLVSKH